MQRNGGILLDLEEEDAEGDGLAGDGGQGRTGDAQIEGEDEQRVQQHIQDAAGGQTHHGPEGVALKAEQVVQHEGRTHPGRTNQNEPQIGHTVGIDGFRGTQEVDQGLHEEQTEHTHRTAAEKRGVEARGGQLVGPLSVLGAQGLGDAGTRALTEEKAQGLDDGHDGEADTHRAGCGGGDHADEEGIGHVINRRDEHGDDGGHRQTANEPLHGSRGHLDELFLRSLFCHCIAFFLCSMLQL